MFLDIMKAKYKIMLISVIMLIISINHAQSANILYVSIVPTHSHYIWNRVLAFELATKGHNVTHLTADRDEVKPGNYNQIYVEDVYKDFHQTADWFKMSQHGLLQSIFDFSDACIAICRAGLRSHSFQQILNYPPDFKFDVIITDASIGTCFHPLIARFNYPATIAVTTLPLPGFLAFSFGNHLQSAYIPWQGLPYSNKMNLLQRFRNYLLMHGDIAIKTFYQRAREEEAQKRVFGKNVPPIDKLERHISLLLANTDPILDNARTLAPNIIPLGGLHIETTKELPKDLEAVVANAQNGVIVVSFGSIIRTSSLDENIQNTLLECFSKLQETVIWKFDTEIEILPKNVLVRKWLPQNDLLGHSNVKLFIGHGGGLSTQEAIYHGVPMLCIPFVLDQHINANNIMNRKLGISVDYRKITVDSTYEKIREILDNPINIKKVSKIYKDRLETPLQRAVFWVEYAIRHNGTQFLNIRARDLPFYVFMELDILALYMLSSVIICLILYKTLTLVKSQCELRMKLKIN